MPRKKQYTPKNFESSKGRGDVSANIYASMIQSPAWKKLTKAQQSLYLHMKLQYYGAKKFLICQKPASTLTKIYGKRHIICTQIKRHFTKTETV